jgi:anti-sigma regulatory factor (Ser/Thr protein kinase)
LAAGVAVLRDDRNPQPAGRDRSTVVVEPKTGEGAPRLAPHAVAASIELAPVATSVPEARHFASGVLPSSCWAEDVTLLVSELASNAVRHARTPFRVTVACDGTVVRIEVSDGDRHVPVARVPPADAVSGRGLLIVDALAASWGVEPTATGKTMWLELPCREPAAD